MTGRTLDRRQVLAGAAAAGLATTFDGLRTAGATPSETGPVTALVPDGVVLGDAHPFSFDLLAQRAAANAQSEWQPTPRIAPNVLDRIDYDAYQQIRFRPEMSLALDPVHKTPIQLFHLGRMSPDPVKIHLVRGDEEQEIVYSAALFESPDDHPAHNLPDGVGFAGFRVMAPNLKTDWLAFMGASYFRTSGPFDQYGLSARGLAIDTGLSTPEEFPRFTEFWLKGGGPGDADLTVYALLDSPSVTGAYEIVTKRTVQDGVARIDHAIDARLFARRDINRLGVAPFSSMYWYGENSRRQIVDWRPEIHDSDGIAIWTGSGERIWRPLNNPPRVMVNTFVDKDVRGFGLLQRDRDFVHYLDDSVFYERRASTWIEPIDAFGEGEVHLLEIPTDDEIHDNIAAYWCPREPFRAGTNRRYRYRLRWLDDIPFPKGLARATATQTGLGGRPGQARPKGVRKFVVDFQGAVFKGLGREDGVEIVVTPTRGELSNAYCHPVVGQRNRWRAFFDLAATGDEPVDIRMYLRLGDRALTETWVYQYFPDSHA
ncbi:glucan biosynthesis protein [Hyphomicrobium sp. CS1GBMeth3]|uniref:glucan biosynthesis protein n=1 Tax=Hyphomicrobium sp. CS1GBMeth3 TaxID=1892845 RepID=UPI0009306160|nr:glucan biosynthesis protein [Hyphomicrobium sp. CS1GBMeth3]